MRAERRQAVLWVLVLWAFEVSQPARALFENAGFLPGGARKLETRGIPLTALRYRRPL